MTSTTKFILLTLLIAFAVGADLTVANHVNKLLSLQNIANSNYLTATAGSGSGCLSNPTSAGIY